MREYLIKAQDGEDLVVAQSDRARMLHPTDSRCEQIDGWGDYRMRCDSTEVAFSFEQPGIQMIVGEGPSDADADRLADSVAAQVQRGTGRATYVVPL